MPNNSKSPNKFFGNIAGAAAGAARNNAFNAIVSKGGIFGKAIQAAQARNVPSVVATAGASNMSGRIESIESRLQALEGGDTSVGAAQPAEVAPAETQAQAAASQMTDANQAVNAASLIGGFAKPIPPVADQAAAASEQLGNLMASPFTMRQRTNMGPLMFKDQTGDGKITRADVIKARIEGYKK